VLHGNPFNLKLVELCEVDVVYSKILEHKIDLLLICICFIFWDCKCQEIPLCTFLQCCLFMYCLFSDTVSSWDCQIKWWVMYEYELKASVKLIFFHKCELAPPRDGYPNSPFSNAAKLIWSYLHVTRQVPNYWLFQNIWWYLYWCKFLQVIFCYLNYTCTVQLIRGVSHLEGVSHLDISFIWWFQHHQGPLLCFLETL